MEARRCQGEPGTPGLPGEPGAAGAPGQPGADGQDGVSGWVVVSNNETSTDHSKTVTAVCPPGKKVVGGGFSVSPGVHVWVEINQPWGAIYDRWITRVNWAGDDFPSWGLWVTAICVTAVP